MTRTGSLLLLLVLAGGARAATPVVADAFPAREERDAFLARGLGVRAAGLGGAYTALSEDAAAAGWNPGGLGAVRTGSALAGYDLIASGAGIGQLAVAVPLPEGAVAFAVTVASYGTIELFDAAGRPAGTESADDLGLQAALGLRLPGLPGGGAGVGVEVTRGAADRPSMAFSAGVATMLGSRLTVGVAGQHMSLERSRGRMPGVVRAGLALRASRALLVTADAGIPWVDRIAYGAAGVEVGSARGFRMRVGYRVQRDQKLGGRAGLTAGLGLRYGHLGLDYAWVPFGALATSHRAALVWEAPPRPAAAVPTQAPEAAAATPEPVAAPEPAAAPPVLISPIPSPEHRQVEMEFEIPAPVSATPAAP